MAVVCTMDDGDGSAGVVWRTGRRCTGARSAAGVDGDDSTVAESEWGSADAGSGVPFELAGNGVFVRRLPDGGAAGGDLASAAGRPAGLADSAAVEERHASCRVRVDGVSGRDVYSVADRGRDLPADAARVSGYGSGL